MIILLFKIFFILTKCKDREIIKTIFKRLKIFVIYINNFLIELVSDLTIYV
jgi:hypothetical protein